MSRNRCWVVLMVAFMFLLFLACFPAFAQEGKGKKNGYVGADTCKGCHEELYEAFKKDTPHWRNYSDPKVPPDRKECESCHGWGEKHVEAEGKGFILSFKDKNAKDRSDPCLKCHQKEKEFFQARRGVHKLSAVGCNDCHKIHGTRTAERLLKAKETDLCFSCHQDVKSKFYLPTRHKVLEGAVKCSDCHTPHGTRTRASLRTWNKFNVDACFKCHPEKRGPWVYEHLGGKAEGCTICHVPHGSPNKWLLIRRDAKTVCMECHGVPHFAPMSCVRCHTQIHGSNFSTKFFQ